MAAADVVATVPEDDEDWLYGDEKEKKPNLGELEKSLQAIKKDFDKEAGELESGEDTERPAKETVDTPGGDENVPNGEEDEEEDEDDDDNVQVTIGDIRTWTGTDSAPRNLFKSGQNYQKAGTAAPTKPAPAAKGLDIEAVGTINGTPVYDFDLNTLSTEDMPWRKPGADITDYFNYGFTEETWKAYCEKQKILRAEATGGISVLPTSLPRYTNSIIPLSHVDKVIPSTVSQSSSSISTINTNNSSGNNNIITIGVIGGSTSRRKDDVSHEQPIPVAGNFNRSIPMNFNQPPPSLPNTNIPPPGMTISPFGAPPPTFETYYHPPTLPAPGPGTYGGTFPPTFPPPFGDPHPPPVTPQQQWETSFPDRWDPGRRDRNVRERSPRREDYEDRLFRERDRDWDRDRDTRDRSRERDRDRSRERERERERDRERDRDRDRDRDRSRSRDKESSRNRDRETSRNRDSSRVKDRDDKHKSSRRKHRDRDREESDTESNRSGGKHKKSKRRKEEKDDEPSAPGTEEGKSKD